MVPRLISLEEHYYSNAIWNGLQPQFRHTLEKVPGLVDKLRNVSGRRRVDMDEGAISFQIISHAFTPGGPGTQRCREGNNELAADIASSDQASRFAAFAVLPISDPAESTRELERCIVQLGFVGALIDNHANGRHFDAPDYEWLWGKAVELDVPIYLHPTFPSTTLSPTFMGNYPIGVGISLGAAGWGWHSDVGLHVLKLFAAGVFDKFPKLKIIIGHFGETLPFMLERCFEMSTSFAGGWGVRERSLKQVWDENIWVTTSGAWSLAPMKCLLENTKVERIMYSVDYPFEDNVKGRCWFEQLEASGLLNEDELEMIGHGNAEKLLKIQNHAS